MRRVIVAGLIVCLGTTALTGCQPGNQQIGGTVVGAAAGGLLAGALFRGSGTVPGIIAGTLIGGAIGNVVGGYMDRQDRENMSQAITTTPVGSQAEWTNDEKHVTYQVRPVKAYHRRGHYCREYRTRIKIGDRWRTAYGKACRKPDGSWKIIK